MATLKECIERYEVAQWTRPADRPIRVIRVAMLQTTAWRADVAHLEGKFIKLGTSREAERCGEMAETGEHLGLERVGRVVDSTETQP